jgi:cytochrome c peroxidase
VNLQPRSNHDKYRVYIQVKPNKNGKKKAGKKEKKTLKPKNYFYALRKLTIILFLVAATIISISFTRRESLRDLYSRPTSLWPAPLVDSGVDWKELGPLPASPIEHLKDSLKHLIELGKVLFFDTRLSSSGKIACASCHQPELSWTDGKHRSIGHDGAVNKRNAPTIQNVWFYNRLFWDGRSSGLEDQAFAPINSESEMHGDMRELPRNLKAIKGYALLFDSAYGDPGIDPDRIAGALAVFQRTIVSNRSRFDEFLAGKRKALSNDELKGLHLFRTKARCMNCHHGPLFTDNLFHNNGFAHGDDGLYNQTHKDEDRGKLKTPSLRDVMFTGPWMQYGQYDNMDLVLSLYNYKKYPGTGKVDEAMHPLGLNPREREDLLAFLKAISTKPLPFTRPVMPQ